MDELPPPSGAGGKSVFNVFGFHGDRYENLDLHSPLEAPPSDFVMSGDSQVSVHPRPTKRRRSTDVVEHLIAPLSPESAQKLSIPRPLWLFFSDGARRIQLGLQENSAGMLQSLDKTGKTLPAKQHSQTSSVPLARRYSKPGLEGEDDIFDTDKVLEKFNNTMRISTGALLSSSKSSRAPNLYRNRDSLVSNSDSKTCDLRRPHSSADLLSIARWQNNTSTNPSEAQNMTDTVNSGLISKYLGRRGSVDSLQSATMVKHSLASEGSDVDKASADALNLTDSSLLKSPAPHIATDMTDGRSQGDSQPKTGFGILSRTRQFGAWLTKTTDGEKVEVSKKDLNTIAPTSF